MPKYEVTFSHRDICSVAVEAKSEREAVDTFKTKIGGFIDVVFVSVEDIDCPDRCDKISDIFY